MQDMEFQATVSKIVPTGAGNHHLYVEDDTMPHGPVPLHINERTTAFSNNVRMKDLKEGDKVAIKFTFRREHMRYTNSEEPFWTFVMDIFGIRKID